MNDGVYIFVLNGVVKRLPVELQKLSLLVYVWSCAVVMVPALEFIFRYCLVVR